MKCHVCGNELKEDWLFCFHCGTKVQSSCEPEKPRGVKPWVWWAAGAAAAVILLAVTLLLLYPGIISAITQPAPKTVQALLEQAEKLASEGNYEEAILAYEAAIEIEPKNETIYLGWADAYEGMGDTESAIRVLSDGYILLESAQLETELSQYLDIVEIRQMLAGQYGEELTVSIQQIDVTDFPTIRVYVDVRDANGVSPDDIKPEFFFLSECQSGNGEYIRRDVEHVTQLDGKESISFNLIADISGSMQGEPLSRAKTIMTNFLETVQFNIGDLVELIAFSNDFSVITPFTSDKSQLAYNIGSLTSYGETALYDALVNAIYLTKDQNGAKTIIAFTDGMDNRSYYSANEVIEIANYYKVPIFIIGIGAGVESRILEQIAISTGGFYRSVSQVDESMQEIYQAIFTAEKEKYMLEYTADAAYAATEARNIVVEIGCRDYAGTSETFEYAPQAHYGYFNGLYLPNGEWDPELFILELNKRYISPSELDQFSEEQIAYIRNGLYALSGKEFKRDKFIDYFNSKPWYSPYAFYLSDPEIVSQFNSYQSANWNIVIAYEAVRGWR